MLPEEIIEAVNAKKFRIYAVSRIEQAIEIMMNHPAGTRRKSGEFAPDTVFSKVQTNLDVLHEASRMK
jgi:predicted ATP-dependent protease